MVVEWRNCAGVMSGTVGKGDNSSIPEGQAGGRGERVDRGGAEQLAHRKADGGDVDYRVVGVDAGDAAHAGKGVGALCDEFWCAAPGEQSVITHTDLAPIARSIAPPIAGMASAAPVCQLARSPCSDIWNAPSTQMSR